MLALVLMLLSQNGCQPGGNCQATSFYPTCAASSTFPACNTSQRGRIRCALTAFDGGSPCQAFCDGSAWACVASGGSSGTDTCTGTTCNIGQAGITTDGGIFLYGSYLTPGLVLDGTTPSYWGGTPGPSMRYQSPFLTLNYAGADRITWGHGTGAMTALTGDVVWSASSFLLNVFTSTTYLRSIGVATASLPTCNAGAAGQIQTDTDIDRPKFCDGAQHVYPVGNIAGTMPGLATIAAADAIVIGNQRMYSGGNVQRIGYAGVVGGTGGGTYTIDVYNNTSAAVECVTGTLACNAGSIGSVDCANASYAAFDDLRIRINCSGCTTCPYVNVNAEYQ